jgi:hypothetical protein
MKAIGESGTVLFKNEIREYRTVQSSSLAAAPAVFLSVADFEAFLCRPLCLADETDWILG